MESTLIPTRPGHTALFLHPKWRQALLSRNNYPIEDVITRVPVIGWLVTAGMHTHAVTPAGEVMGNNAAVELSDGRVVTLSGRVFASVDLWVGNLLGSGV